MAILLPKLESKSPKAVVWEVVKNLDPNQPFIIDQMVEYIKTEYPNVQSKNMRDTVRALLNQHQRDGHLINLGRDGSGRVVYKRGKV